MTFGKNSIKKQKQIDYSWTCSSTGSVPYALVDICAAATVVEQEWESCVDNEGTCANCIKNIGTTASPKYQICGGSDGDCVDQTSKTAGIVSGCSS